MQHIIRFVKHQRSYAITRGSPDCISSYSTPPQAVAVSQRSDWMLAATVGSANTNMPLKRSVVPACHASASQKTSNVHANAAVRVM
jgi:hypothetical protein